MDKKDETVFGRLKASTTNIRRHLTIIRPNERFTVAVDTSDTGIGAMSAGVIEYAIRLVASTERKCSTTEKECLATVWVLEKWRISDRHQVSH